MTAGRSGDRVLTTRELNRATLERQLLLRRAGVGVPTAVEQIMGLNAQVSNPPYLSLWSRVEGFERDHLERLIMDRTAVRSPVVRGTQRLVTADDFAWMRPAVAPTLARGVRSTFGRQLDGLDLAELAQVARSALEVEPRSGAELRRILVQRFPSYDRSALAQSVIYLVPLVATPPAGLWGSRARITHALAEQWLGRPLDAEPDLARLVVRYLAAFGPATPADLREWSRVAGLRAVFDELRPSLRTYRDEDGRELFDLPDAPMPDPATPAPVRFLPDFDELLMAHADRRRVMTDEVRRVACIPDIVKATVLVDGVVAAMWRIERDGDDAELLITLLGDLAERDRESIAEEGARLLAFAEPDVRQTDVRILPPVP